MEEKGGRSRRDAKNGENKKRGVYADANAYHGRVATALFYFYLVGVTHTFDIFARNPAFGPR